MPPDAEDEDPELEVDWELEDELAEEDLEEDEEEVFVVEFLELEDWVVSDVVEVWDDVEVTGVCGELRM